MNVAAIKPKERPSFLIKLGKLFYSCKRYIKWYTAASKYTKARQRELLPFSAFQHQTLLFRELKDVEMSDQQNKVTNLKLAVARLDGVIVQPGETFSYWKQIGKTTKSKGYVDGMVIQNGLPTKATGGGLCQLSNLIYWMSLHTPLTVTERHRHNFDVFPDANRTQPFGTGATCSYNTQDLQIKNETAVPYQLHVRVTNSHLCGEWRCAEPQPHHYHIYEKEHSITPANWGGHLRHNIIGRKVYNKQHKLIADEIITENHAIMMYEPQIESNNQEPSIV